MAIDYDTVASAYDRRYVLHEYPGIRSEVLGAVEKSRARVLEVGCGTGKWLSELSSAGCDVAGIDPSAAMLDRATRAVRGDLRRGTAEALPWADATFDLVIFINAFHHFSDPRQALVEAFRVLQPEGKLLSIGMDPHEKSDRWWVYDFFPETLELDRRRYPSTVQRLAWLAAAGFRHPVVRVAERLTSTRSLPEALRDGVLARIYTSQLTALTDEQYAAGLKRLDDRHHDDGTLRLVADLTLYATEARKPG